MVKPRVSLLGGVPIPRNKFQGTNRVTRPHCMFPVDQRCLLAGQGSVEGPWVRSEELKAVIMEPRAAEKGQEQGPAMQTRS